ncbi:Undecaprenyl-phosphate glucose phosphotransferase [Paenibacillus algorifonticola]|uniref:Undecaprenyl-phosphate glucose phosphotransferase n=1 Tax=Paenibacillus algorifonticola TaxID=684063 RepID=A0A1I2E017_9BACL|nr:undecaprenyl-phosphate glucose phosphotransferase [Paenibacillus algorifonticola]SFE85891.1 Undecaprenyl-phosphate glucose phosphotransferase [Paenibacillus algorifonticola]
MIRQNQRILSQLYMLADLLCTLIVFLAAYWLKFYSDWLSYVNSVPFSTYLVWGTVYSFSAVVVGFYLQFYSPKRRKNYSYEVLKIIQIQTISFLFLLSLFYFTGEVHISRELLLIFFLMNIAAIALYRYIVKSMLFSFRRRGYNKRYVLIVGAGSVGRSFYHNLQKRPELGYEAVGFLDDYQGEHAEEHQFMQPIIGKLDDLEAKLNELTIDEVIIALPLEAHKKYAQIIETCEKTGVKTLIIPDFFDLLPARPFFDNFAGIPLINVRDVPLDELSNRVLKRGFDIIFSLIAILITSPIMLATVIGIKLTSPGPVLFKQERMGLNRKNFFMYKFRSMRVSTGEVSNTQWTVENDPRRTKFGSFLRRTSLDELPQFFNVLFGHMSVVGPRPERPYFVSQFKEEIPKYMIKHQIRPGITGWAQTNGLRGDTSIEDRIVHDLFYIENWTFILDLKIIVMTIVRGFVNKNAY